MKKIALALLMTVAGFVAQAQTKAPKATPVKKEACLSKGKSCCNDKALSALRRPVAKPAMNITNTASSSLVKKRHK